MYDELEKFLAANRLDGVIRIWDEEYGAIPEEGRLTHFVLPPTTTEVGFRYALPRIIKPGVREANGTETLPILSLTDIYIGECLAVEEKAYGELVETDFEHSLRHIRSADDLKRLMLKRYRTSRPNMAEEDLLARGVSKIDFIVTRYAA